MIFIQENAFENVVCKMASISSQPQCVKLMFLWSCFKLFHAPYNIKACNLFSVSQSVSLIMMMTWYGNAILFTGPLWVETARGFPSPMPVIQSFDVIIPPTSTKLKGGYTGITLAVCPSVRLSVCGQNRVRSVSSTILIGSISYLHILSSNFRRCVTCNARFKIQKFEILANFFNL